MANFIARQKRSRQPRGRVPISAAIPRPSFLFCPSAELADQMLLTRVGTPASGDQRVESGSGVAYSVVRQTSGGLDFGTTQPFTSDTWTCAVLTDVSSTHGRSVQISQRSTEYIFVGANSNNTIGLSAGRISVVTRDASLALRGSHSVSTSALNSEGFKVISATKASVSSYPSIYLNGLQLSTEDAGSATGSSIATNQKFRIGNLAGYDSNDIYCSKCNIAAVVIWPSVLPERLIARLNPEEIWDLLYGSSSRPVFFFSPPRPYSGFARTTILSAASFSSTRPSASFQELGTLQNARSASLSSLSTTIANVAVGDLLVVVVQRDRQDQCTGVASSSPSLTFTKVLTAQSGENHFNTDLWAAIATSSASSQTITASYSASSSYGAIFSARYSSGVSSITPNATTAHTTLQYYSTDRTNSNMTTTARTLMLAFGTNWNYYYLVSAATNWTKRVDCDTFGDNSTVQFLFDRVADAGTYPSGNYGTNESADDYFSGIAALPVTVTGSFVIPTVFRNFSNMLAR